MIKCLFAKLGVVYHNAVH